MLPITITIILFGSFIYLITRSSAKEDEFQSKLWDNEEEGRTGKTVIKILRSEYPFPNIKTPEHWEKNMSAKRVNKWFNHIANKN